jgi:AcrR family transcriptional regulator
MLKNKEETIEKIKEAAISEFLDKGYAKASLRTICQKAGVTTGALYFSFESKEALFRAILNPLIVQYESLLAKYMDIEMKDPATGSKLDVLMMEFVLNHKRETIIIMEKAQGSCYEDYRNHVEQLMEQSFRAYYAEHMMSEPNEDLIKILAKIRLDGCLEIIKGNYDMEYSLYLSKKIGIYASGGTKTLIKDLLEEVRRN